MVFSFCVFSKNLLIQTTLVLDWTSCRAILSSLTIIEIKKQNWINVIIPPKLLIMYILKISKFVKFDLEKLVEANFNISVWFIVIANNNDIKIQLIEKNNSLIIKEKSLFFNLNSILILNNFIKRVWPFKKYGISIKTVINKNIKNKIQK